MKQVLNKAPHWGLVGLMMAWFLAAEAGSAAAAESKAQKTNAVAKATEAAAKSPVDVNSADAKTLETLPGIGPALASKIIAGRPYHDLAELGKVKGLSQSKLQTLKNDVTFGPAITAAKETASQQAAKTPKGTNATQTAASKASPASTSSAAAAGGAKKAQTGGAASKLAPGQKFNINTANAQELDRLPGIGPTRAQAIINYRTQNGSFKSIDDIQKVKGIKTGEFTKIKDYIKVTE